VLCWKVRLQEDGDILRTILDLLGCELHARLSQPLLFPAEKFDRDVLCTKRKTG
jgi:hypothetical protein